MPATTVSPDDLLRMPDEGQGYELIAGELRERTKTCWCSLVAGEVSARIASAAGNSGWTVGSGVGFQCFADRNTVRRADAIIMRVLNAVQAPEKPLDTHVRVATA